MADSDPSASPSVWRLIFSSRKAVIAMVFGAPILFTVVCAEIALAVMMVRKDLDPKVAIVLMFGSVLGAAFGASQLAKPLILSWSAEEVAKTNATAGPTAVPVPVIVNTGASATATPAPASKSD